MAGRCWLCENSANADVQSFHTFAVQSAHCVDALAMARHLQEHLLESLGEDACPSVEEIHTHLQKHVLHPTVRIAHILRSLLDLSETLREVVVSRAEDDTPLIDVRTVTVYLKVVSEIMQVYKNADTTRMLFSDQSQ